MFCKIHLKRVTCFFFISAYIIHDLRGGVYYLRVKSKICLSVLCCCFFCKSNWYLFCFSPPPRSCLMLLGVVYSGFTLNKLCALTSRFFSCYLDIIFIKVAVFQKDASLKKKMYIFFHSYNSITTLYVN